MVTLHRTNYYETYPGFKPPPSAPPDMLPPRSLTRRERRAERKAAKRAARRARSGSWMAPLIFSLFLFLIGGGVLTVLALNYADIPAALWKPYDEDDFGDYFDDYGDADDDEALPATTIQRAPTAQGITLPLLPPTGQPMPFQEIYEKNIPSIVSVLTASDRGESSGTGVVLTEDGYIITNHHVIQGGHSVQVVLHDGRRYPAMLVGGDQANDLAVLKIPSKDLTPAEFGSSEALRVGDEALAIGNPLGEELRGTMTDGIISAIDRDVSSDGNTMTLIQTTAALNSGNSGGALINVFGQVVGITNMKMMSYYNTIEGLGFAIPSTTAKAVAEELIATGHISGRPVLGFTGYSLSAEEAGTHGFTEGVYVSTVDPKSDAYEQGLRPGDIVIECNGKTISSVAEVNAIKGGFRAGDSLTLRISRGGESLDIEVRLMEKYELDD